MEESGCHFPATPMRRNMKCMALAISLQKKVPRILTTRKQDHKLSPWTWGWSGHCAGPDRKNWPDVDRSGGRLWTGEPVLHVSTLRDRTPHSPHHEIRLESVAHQEECPWSTQWSLVISEQRPGNRPGRCHSAVLHDLRHLGSAQCFLL